MIGGLCWKEAGSKFWLLVECIGGGCRWYLESSPRPGDFLIGDFRSSSADGSSGLHRVVLGFVNFVSIFLVSRLGDDVWIGGRLNNEVWIEPLTDPCDGESKGWLKPPPTDCRCEAACCMRQWILNQLDLRPYRDPDFDIPTMRHFLNRHALQAVLFFLLMIHL